MKKELKINDKSQHVALEKLDAENHQIKIGDQAYAVTLLSDQDNRIVFMLDGKILRLDVSSDGAGKIFVNCDGEALIVHDQAMESLLDSSAEGDSKKSANPNEIYSQIPGKVVKINFKEGDRIVRGDVILITEAMKTELSYETSMDGHIESIPVKLGDQIASSKLLVKIKGAAQEDKPEGK